MLRCGSVLLEMNARDGDSGKGPSSDERVFILAELIPLGYVGIKIILAVELGEIADRTTDREPDAKHMTNGFKVDRRKGSGMSHAYGADIHVWPLFVGVVLRGAEHLRLGTKFSVNF